MNKVILVPFEDFGQEYDHAMQIMETVDENDSVFLAVGLALGIQSIWTEDRHFLRQDLLKVYQPVILLKVFSVSEGTCSPLSADPREIPGPGAPQHSLPAYYHAIFAASIKPSALKSTPVSTGTRPGSTLLMPAAWKRQERTSFNCVDADVTRVDG